MRTRCPVGRAPPHGKPSIYHFLALELFDPGRAHPEDFAQHFIVMLPERGRGPEQVARRAAHAMFETFVGRRSHFLVIEPVPEAERFEVFVAMEIHAVLHRIGGYAAA